MCHKKPVLGCQFSVNKSSVVGLRSSATSLVSCRYRRDYFFFFAGAFLAADFFAAFFFAPLGAASSFASPAGAAFFGFGSFFGSSGALKDWPSKAISVMRTALKGWRCPRSFLYCFLRL